MPVASARARNAAPAPRTSREVVRAPARSGCGSGDSRSCPARPRRRRPSSRRSAAPGRSRCRRTRCASARCAGRGALQLLDHACALVARRRGARRSSGARSRAPSRPAGACRRAAGARPRRVCRFALAQVLGAHLGVRDRTGSRISSGIGRSPGRTGQDRLGSHLVVGQLPVVEAVGLVAGQLAAAHEQHLHLDDAALAVEAEDVLVGAPVRRPPAGAPASSRSRGSDRAAAPPPRSARVRGGLHARAQRRAPARRSCPRGAASPLRRCSRTRRDRPAGTHGPEAALDLVLEAGPGAVAEHGVAAGAQREDLADRVERLAHRRRAGERAEVAAAVLARSGA